MIQTLAALVDETGKIRLLTEIRLEKSRRAWVTILEDESKEAETSKKENLRAVFISCAAWKCFAALQAERLAKD